MRGSRGPGCERCDGESVRHCSQRPQPQRPFDLRHQRRHLHRRQRLRRCSASAHRPARALGAAAHRSGLAAEAYTSVVSKAFTRDTDDELAGMLAIDDHALPAGAKNYVTPAGLEALRVELERLRTMHPPDARGRAELERRAQLVARRIDAAEVVDPRTQPPDRVTFGATVTVRLDDATERTYRIVGIDEADARRGWVSWLSPVARALLNARCGDSVTMRVPGGNKDVEIVAIAYDG